MFRIFLYHYVRYYGYTRIIVTHRNFTEAKKYSFYKIMMDQRDFNIPIMIRNTHCE
jgi:hypothetical protein